MRQQDDKRQVILYDGFEGVFPEMQELSTCAKKYSDIQLIEQLNSQ